jgi:hypothetical protein
MFNLCVFFVRGPWLLIMDRHRLLIGSPKKISPRFRGLIIEPFFFFLIELFIYAEIITSI